MNIVVTKKHTVTYTIKVAIGTLAIFTVIGLFARWIRNSDRAYPSPPQSLVELLTTDQSLLVPSIMLDVQVDANEAAWTSALAAAMGGQSEVKVAFGRADVLTQKYAVEVDFLPKWKEGMGQAIHYADVTDRRPVLAVIHQERPDQALLEQIESLCTKNGVKLVLLAPKN
jgi:hypothetical protein